MWRMVRLGVDLIISNRPDRLGKVLDAASATGQSSEKRKKAKS
jgi:hypothetical protein